MSLINLILDGNSVTVSYLIRYDNLLQKCDIYYYKIRQLFYYKMQQFYYKMQQLLRTAPVQAA